MGLTILLSWHVYYSGGSQAGPQHSLVLKGGRTPWDAYEFLGSLRPDDEWAIDGTLLTVNSQDYFVYSGYD